MDILAKGRKSGFLTAIMLGVTLGIVGVAMALDVGDKAPDFTLQSTTGEKITLSEYRGKKHVLIEFYAIDFNPA